VQEVRWPEVAHDEVEGHSGLLRLEEAVGLPIMVVGCQEGTETVCDAWTSILKGLARGEIFRCQVARCLLIARATALLYLPRRFVLSKDGSVGKRSQFSDQAGVRKRGERGWMDGGTRLEGPGCPMKDFARLCG
jgi:hypothetical protein